MSRCLKHLSIPIGKTSDDVAVRYVCRSECTTSTYHICYWDLSFINNPC